MERCYPASTDWSCYAGYPDAAPYTELDPNVKARSEMLAWMSLQTLTGLQVGGCPIAVRPCAAGCGAPGTWFVAPVLAGSLAGTGIGNPGSILRPYIANGVWFNGCGCGVGDGCGCSRLSEARLPGPVGEVHEVRIDGQVIAPSSYRIDNFDRLVRIDGGTWPLCQDMAAAPDEEGSFIVTMTQGWPADPALNFAAGLLAMEYVKACTNQKCKLPGNAVQVARAGVTIELGRDVFTQGTGIPAVDEVVRAYNPYGLRSAPEIVSVEHMPVRKTTWWG